MALVTVVRSLDFVLRVRGTTDELLQRRSYRTVCNSESSLAVTCGPDWRGDGVGQGAGSGAARRSLGKS